MGLVFRLQTHFVRSHLERTLRAAQELVASAADAVATLETLERTHPRGSPPRTAFSVGGRMFGTTYQGVDEHLRMARNNLDAAHGRAATLVALHAGLQDNEEKRIGCTPDDVRFLERMRAETRESVYAESKNREALDGLLKAIETRAWEAKDEPEDRPTDTATLQTNAQVADAPRLQAPRRARSKPPTTPVGATSDNPNPASTTPGGVRDGGTEAPPAETAPLSGAKSE